ncbi:sensor histidine kinase [Paenactinomyces guangxiensis]|uniref:histidine kinase n=1 Tax=Paenactinomyces guangxiensis TaxID=1490290 RepID=A0A7W2A8I1_9BACL|nr:HAMP domain-containing sensor histidine kinase [Paenactinomyces guangxiensis]MBA4493848.1 HAMP domain-containing histidine kinase [Paenactinomyces guangxiensis]MBH8591314.1 HAMP domain-containing histidine kinase [Paenactinomyces guangxiensis]
MKLSGRIMWQFLWRLFSATILSFLLYVGGILVLFNFPLKSPKEDRLESPRNLIADLSDKTDIHGEKVTPPPDLLQEIKKRRGWMQVLDDQGREIYQYRRPSHFPVRYSPGVLADYQNDRKQSGYDIHTWYQKKNNRIYTWIYALPNINELTLLEMKKHTSIHHGRAAVAPQVLKKIEKMKSWVQILDDQGKEIFAHHRPDKQPRVYPPGFFVYHDQYGSNMYYLNDTINGKTYTWVLGGAKKQSDIYPYSEASHYQINKAKEWFQLFYYSSFIGSIGIFLFVAFLFGNRISRPVLHMMNWLQHLARGVYREPVNKKGLPKSIHPSSGKLRRPYRTFKEVIASLQQLTDTLKENEENRRRLERTREEWIAGVSHDLKTPLSSVKGYADLLSEEGYDWKQDEVRQYAKVIQDKALYMEHLIEDLNLTFRLKNEALPLQRKKEDLVEIVRRSVIDLANNSSAEDQHITFHSEENSIYFPVDQQWFQRAFNNLLTNASIHNPPGTEIAVQIGKSGDGESVVISIEDNGQGMDAETVSRLFDRYYRGTSTSHKGAGTGLGMAIAEQLIKAHGGTIKIESSVGKGTKILICLSGGESER